MTMENLDTIRAVINIGLTYDLAGNPTAPEDMVNDNTFSALLGQLGKLSKDITPDHVAECVAAYPDERYGGRDTERIIQALTEIHRVRPDLFEPYDVRKMLADSSSYEDVARAYLIERATGNPDKERLTPFMDLACDTARPENLRRIGMTCFELLVTKKVRRALNTDIDRAIALMEDDGTPPSIRQAAYSALVPFESPYVFDKPSRARDALLRFFYRSEPAPTPVRDDAPPRNVIPFAVAKS